jgi:CHAT domain-containing protein
MKQGDMGNFQALCQTQEEAWKLLQNIPIKPAPRYAATSLKNLQAQMDPEVVFLYPIGPSAPVTALLLTSDTIAFSTFDRYDFADTLFSKQLDSLILWASDRKNPASFDRFLEVGFELYTRMLAPIRPLWEGKRIVVISPHQRIGPLQLLPTRPCRRQDGEIPYLLREATVSYHHSAQAYLENARVPFQEPVRMLAAAPFGRHEMVKKRGLFRNLAREARDFRKASSESCKLTPDPLPYSGEEVAKIGPLWRGSRVVYERDASESEIRRLAQSCNVLHLATHSDAFYEPEGPLQHWVYFHPDAMHDGSLSFREFRSLPLQHVELAVFSSCQSGNCYNNTGSGIADFGSMAQFAGVQSAVASWWDVSDEATSYLMEKFHRHLANGMRKDDALRQAQLDYLEDSLNDRTLSLWGGFYLQGNPRPLRPEAPASFEGAPATAASRIGWLSLSIVLLLLAGMGFYQYRKK